MAFELPVRRSDAFTITHLAPRVYEESRGHRRRELHVEFVTVDGPAHDQRACNPTLAGQALDAEPQIGVLLPCNVVVRQSDNNVVVEAMDPGLMATIVGTEPVRPIADEARRLVGNAMERLSASG